LSALTICVSVNRVLFIFDNLKLLTFSLILNCPVFRGTYIGVKAMKRNTLIKWIL